MKAFGVAYRAISSLGREFYLLSGLSLLWWLLGGFFAGVSAVLVYIMFMAGGPWWLMPLLAIPVGPATAALAVVTRRCTRNRAADRGIFMEGLRTYWRMALGISAVGMVGIVLVLFNLVFYVSRSNVYLQVFGLFWLYLACFLIATQMYAYPILVGMEKPSTLGALRLALTAAFGNPFFSIVLVLMAAALTAVSVVVVILLFFVWPALMALLDEHSLRLFLERAGVKLED